MPMERRSRSGDRRRRTWSYHCKEYLRQFVAFMFSNVGIIGLVVGYTIIGSFIFIKIEENSYNALATLNDVRTLRNITANHMWFNTCCQIYEEPVWKEVVEIRLKEFQKKIVDKVLNGYEGDKDSGPTEYWTFSGSFLYSLSVITTIGYGNVAPRTGEGKFATIIYAIAGMPLFLLYLSNIGDILAKSVKWIYAKCHRFHGCSKCLTRYPASYRYSQESQVQDGEQAHSEIDYSDEDEWSSDGGDDPQTVTVPITHCLIIMVGYVCSGALFFAEWEKWSLLDAAYFCFISLSTIGFGDIVPEMKRGTSFYGLQGVDLSFIFCSMYLMLGMALIAMCFNLMQEEVVHKVRSCTQMLKRIILCQR